MYHKIGGFSRYIGSGPEKAKKGACESLKGPISLAIDVLFWFFLYFQLFFVDLEK
jgi:hypothetical protein